ncbi:hypothetical protein Ciccas_010295 [Cichlidogyrus casuarinus]|uniref:Uncharacterized protein n=1 Tax=Cichlidogyrus casuarinus TaxID=1844966 RepID=A0ABD2PVM2_9PLAT
MKMLKLGCFFMLLCLCRFSTQQSVVKAACDLQIEGRFDSGSGNFTLVVVNNALKPDQEAMVALGHGHVRDMSSLIRIKSKDKNLVILNKVFSCSTEFVMIKCTDKNIGESKWIRFLEDELTKSLKTYDISVPPRKEDTKVNVTEIWPGLFLVEIEIMKSDRKSCMYNICHESICTGSKRNPLLNDTDTESILTASLSKLEIRTPKSNPIIVKTEENVWQLDKIAKNLTICACLILRN